MAIQDAELQNKYQPPAEQASVPSSFRSALENKYRHASRVTEVALGKSLPSQFSVEGHVSSLPNEPRLGPSREQAPSSDVPWGALAVLAAGVGFAGAEATLFSKVGLKKGLIVNGTLLTGIACLAQPTEANAAITAVASTATPQPTESPTVEPTPTEIAVGQVDPEHPQAGPRPEGADKIINNEWTKPNPENAEKPFVYKTVTDPKTKEVITQGWFTDQGGGPMLDAPNSGVSTSANFHVWCEEGLHCPTISHLPNTEPRNTNLDFSSLLVSKLYDSRFKKIYDDRRALNQGLPTFDDDLKAGKISLHFINANGDEYDYRISKDTSANVYVVNWDNIKADVEWSVWRSNTTGDDKGNLNLVAAVDSEKKSIDSMSPREFMELVTYPYFRVIFKENQDKATFQVLGPAGSMTQLVDLAIKGENPYFSVTR